MLAATTVRRSRRSHQPHQPRRARSLLLCVVLVFALLPAGPAVADTTEVCEGAPVTVFGDQSSIAGDFVDNVNCMAAYGITRGVDEVPNFAPGDPVTRQQMATFIARMMVQAEEGSTDIPAGSPAAFTDVTADNNHYAAINWLAELRVTTGVTQTTYEPGRSVTREQMASFIARSLRELDLFEVLDEQQVLDDFEGQAFPDLDEGAAVHVPNIELLQALGVIRGRGDGTYAPTAPVTRQQMSQFIMEAAAVLERAGLWNGQFVGLDPTDPTDPTDPDETPTDPTDPTDPDPDETPTSPTDPTDPDPVDPPSNQSFALTPPGPQTVPTGTQLSFEAEVGDATDVTVWLLDADTVIVAGEVVTMNLDAGGVLDPGLVAPGAAQITEIDGVVLPAGIRSREVAVTDGSVELTIEGLMSPTSLYVVVTEGDTDDVVDALGAAIVDGDDALEAAFGVAGPIVTADVDGIALLRADTGAPILGGNVPADVTVTVAAALVTGLDLEPIVDPASVVDLVVPVDDEDVEVVVAELATAVDSSTSAALAASTAAATLECDILQDNPATLLASQIVDSDIVEVDQGVALVDVDGPDAEVYHCLLASWDGAPAGAYDGESATSYGPAADPRAAGHGLITWLEGDPTLTTLAFTATEERNFVEVDGTVGLQVQALDQFGDPVVGAEVEFARDRFADGDPATTDELDRTTNMMGIATLNYVSDENRVDEITATWTDPDDPLNVVAVGSMPFSEVLVFFFEDAVAPAPGAMGDDYVGELLLADDEDGLLINTSIPPGVAPPGAGPFVRLPYGGGDSFGVNTELVTLPDFRMAMAAADPFDLGVLVAVENLLDQSPMPASALWEVVTAVLDGTDSLGPGNSTAAVQLVPFLLTDYAGNPIEGVTIAFTDDGVGSVAAPGEATTNPAGQANATYLPAPVGDVGATVTITGTTMVNGSPVSADAEVVFD